MAGRIPGAKTGSARRRLSRRAWLKGAAAAAVGGFGGFPRPAIAQPPTVRYTLSWLPTGGNAYVYVARQLGYWKKRGIEVELTRGYGSMAAIQAVSQGQFDFGNAGTGAVLLSVIKGLDLTLVNTIGYDSGIGIIVPAQSPITTPRALAGHTVAATAAGADTPFLPPYFKRLGLPDGSVTIVHVDSRIIEQTVIQGRTDAMVAIASSSVPNFMANDIKIRFFPVAEQGLTLYGSSTIASSAYLKANRSLAADFVAGMLEGLRFSLLNPAETIERFLKEHPVMAMKQSARRIAEIGLGIAVASTVAPESEGHSLGYTDLTALDQQAQLVRAVQGSETDRAPPPIASYATNDLIGHVALASAEWRRVRDYAAPFAAAIGRTLSAT
ncbi:MAG TPA: ABC transporter substrate-binding protein [Candidatus Sulfotelmatobacter sp.]|nr:ABC transporter substrate-binding protein [Candidatus Sulfotelmatobacter sp.]